MLEKFKLILKVVQSYYSWYILTYVNLHDFWSVVVIRYFVDSINSEIYVS